jgi:hypothetical protein
MKLNGEFIGTGGIFEEVLSDLIEYLKLADILICLKWPISYTLINNDGVQ